MTVGVISKEMSISYHHRHQLRPCFCPASNEEEAGLAVIFLKEFKNLLRTFFGWTIIKGNGHLSTGRIPLAKGRQEEPGVDL